jgi:hypothetical protein
MVSSFGCAVSQSYSTVLIARYFQAFGAAGPLALGPASIKGTRFSQWISAALMGAALIGVILAVPEV